MKKGLKIFALVTAIVALMSVGVMEGFTSRQADFGETAVYAAVLKQGSTGEVVRTVQTKLKRWGYYSGPVDGIFGSKTKAAVVYFQRRNGLTPDGIVGSRTLAALGISGGQSQQSPGGVGGYSSQDVKLLARVIYGEARGESYTGQVAVAAVVLNRVKNPSFPNTISGVVYQPYAFTAVNDGQINLTPNSSAYKAAQDAINGWDPTGGALYYYNPRTATSSWIFTRKVTVTIGSHVFAV